MDRAGMRVNQSGLSVVGFGVTCASAGCPLLSFPPVLLAYTGPFTGHPVVCEGPEVLPYKTSNTDTAYPSISRLYTFRLSRYLRYSPTSRPTM